MKDFIKTEHGETTIDGYPFQTSKRVNGDDSAMIRGWEFSFQQSLDEYLPDYAKGFGIIANYTYSNSDGGDKNIFEQAVPFKGMSKNSYNFITYYENGDFSTRLAYNYRDEYLASAASQSYYRDYYKDATGRLDWSASYQVMENLSLRTSVRNLTDEGNRFYRLNGSEELQGNQGYAGRYISFSAVAQF